MNTHRTPDTEPELEHAAAGLFGSLAADEMDAGASASIHSDIASALANGTRVERLVLPPEDFDEGSARPPLPTASTGEVRKAE